jgi:hypothetical protein
MTTAIKPQELTKYEKIQPYFGNGVIEYINQKLQKGSMVSQKQGKPISVTVYNFDALRYIGEFHEINTPLRIDWVRVAECYTEAGWVVKEGVRSDVSCHFIFSTTIEPMGLPKTFTKVVTSNARTFRSLLDRLFKRS